MLHASLALLLLQESQPAPAPAPAIEELRAAGSIAGLAFTDAELELMRAGVGEQLASLEALRKFPLANSDAPALRWRPWADTRAPLDALAEFKRFGIDALPRLAAIERERPASLDELAFWSIPELAALVRTRKVTCLELAEWSMARLQRLDPQLHAVVAITRERAVDAACMRDRELEKGIYRGYLHGIPYGAKDLLAVKGSPTTWGSKIFAAQQFDTDAAVIERLDDAGAVLVAKLSLGELAMGDQWFGGMTRNPWKPDQGSSGSSAGSASAVAAGCVPFAIGSETLGSIVSPSTRCGCSSIRPTFDLVDTRGAMALSWSMDKLGPLCRSVEDAAIVLQAIAPVRKSRQGAGLHSRRAPAIPELWIEQVEPLAGFRIGYPAQDFEHSKRDQPVLEDLKRLGAELVPIELPDYPVWDMMIILSAEAACSFDELTRDGRDEQMVDQSKDGWPNLFRVARLIPATDYVRADRMRARLAADFEALFRHAEIDAIVHPSFGPLLGIGNLTGNPTVVAPSGFAEDGTPYSISFTGPVYEDTQLLHVARSWQVSTQHHERHPQLGAAPAAAK
jgi:Asp-tRNA(Asn)/Glu-tRNA(Gln) amidotransferase A subunit family amidase